MSLNNNLCKQLNSLMERFERELDPTLLSAAAERFIAQPASHIGEGTNWRCFKVNTKGLPLVLKIPQYIFESGRPISSNWRQKIAEIHDQGIPLIPPFRLVDFRDQFLMVMPMMSRGVQGVNPEWSDISSLTKLHTEMLAAVGLRNFDILQFGTVEGIPFVFDLSDIREQNVRNQNHTPR